VEYTLKLILEPISLLIAENTLKPIVELTSSITLECILTPIPELILRPIQELTSIITLELISWLILDLITLPIHYDTLRDYPSPDTLQERLKLPDELTQEIQLS